MSENWVNGTNGRFVKFNGCRHYDDCFSCIYKDCKVASSSIRSEKTEKTGRKCVNQNPIKQKYYQKHREEILEKARLKKLEKNRQAQVC